jgi:hypothetical protein
LRIKKTGLFFSGGHHFFFKFFPRRTRDALSFSIDNSPSGIGGNQQQQHDSKKKIGDSSGGDYQ